MKPPNEKGTLLHVPIPNLPLAEEYHFPCSPQACFKAWQREAARLLGNTGAPVIRNTFVRFAGTL